MVVEERGLEMMKLGENRHQNRSQMKADQGSEPCEAAAQVAPLLEQLQSFDVADVESDHCTEGVQLAYASMRM